MYLTWFIDSYLLNINVGRYNVGGRYFKCNVDGWVFFFSHVGIPQRVHH